MSYYDCVVTSAHHPMLCGTAKFSHQLAERLGVPCVTSSRVGTYALYSVRASEMSWGFPMAKHYDLFLHDWDFRLEAYRDAANGWLRLAERVFAANSTIADQIRPMRPDVVTLWAPSTIQGNPHRGAINVLTFGMAHKIQAHRYEKLKTLLDATGDDYTVSVSTAIHEGSPWDETAKVADRLRGIFAERLRVLGYLADDAMARELRDCTSCAIFFDPALRANNTSAWAVLEAGRPLVTNLDDRSPKVRCYDIDQMSGWFAVPARIQPQGTSGWADLINVLHGQVPSSVCAS